MYNVTQSLEDGCFCHIFKCQEVSLINLTDIWLVLEVLLIHIQPKLVKSQPKLGMGFCPCTPQQCEMH